jgi:hypothetical protein
VRFFGIITARFQSGGTASMNTCHMLSRKALSCSHLRYSTFGEGRGKFIAHDMANSARLV